MLDRMCLFGCFKCGDDLSVSDADETGDNVSALSSVSAKKDVTGNFYTE
jgi:hypothetical protein